MDPPRHGDVGRAVDEIVSFASAARSDILEKGMAASQTVNGTTNTDNFFVDPTADGETRRHVSSISTIRIRKPLSRDFRLFDQASGIIYCFSSAAGADISAVCGRPPSFGGLGVVAVRQIAG